MLAEALQNVPVVLSVLAAAAYLGFLLRRAWKGQGGCGSCRSASPAREAKNGGGAKAFMPLDNFSDLARRHQQTRSASKSADQ